MECCAIGIPLEEYCLPLCNTKYSDKPEYFTGQVADKLERYICIGNINLPGVAFGTLFHCSGIPLFRIYDNIKCLNRYKR